MNGPDHYREAERLLDEATSRGDFNPKAQWCLELAKLHTALAHVAATAQASDGRNGSGSPALVRQYEPGPARAGTDLNSPAAEPSQPRARAASHRGAAIHDGADTGYRASGCKQPDHAAPACTDSGQRRFSAQTSTQRRTAPESKRCIPGSQTLTEVAHQSTPLAFQAGHTGSIPGARSHLLSAVFASRDSISVPTADRSLRKRPISWKPSTA
jgi:hypothetical protein